jgi:hypothetical protein
MWQKKSNRMDLVKQSVNKNENHITEYTAVIRKLGDKLWKYNK